jgi:GNAT superfamily N-acetyltransferase
MSTLAVRPALSQDEVFLYELYRAVRGPQFDQTPLNAEQKEHMLRFQFQAQLSSYTQQYPNSCFHIVLIDGRPCGRLWVAPGERNLHLVDIAMHPSVQKKGVGTVLVQRVQQEAQQRRVPITSMVDRFNPGSLRFHKRLGFSIVREDLLNYYMEWTPAPLVG